MSEKSKYQPPPQAEDPQGLPPPYSEVDESSDRPTTPGSAPEKTPDYSKLQNQHQYDREKQPIPGQQQYAPGGTDPNQSNVYFVPPQLVNITQANPQHLNPSYQQYLQRDEERIRQGDYPKGPEQFKHGAPLNPGTINPSDRTGGSRFPGRAGASYNNAANR